MKEPSAPGIPEGYPDEPASTDAEFAQKRLGVLHDLWSKSVTSAETADAVCRAAAQVLNDTEIAFAHFYLLDSNNTRLRLAASARASGIEVPAALVELDTEALPWNAGRILRTGEPEVIDRTMVLPLGPVGPPPACGLLVLGVRARQVFDAPCRAFLELVGTQVTALLCKLHFAREERPSFEPSDTALFALFMQIPVPICVLRGQDLVFEAANQPFCDMLGRAHLVGRTFEEAFPELRDQGTSEHKFSELLRGVMSTGTLFEHHELPATITRNGRAELAYFNAVFAPVVSADGKVERVVAVGTEITNEVVGRVKAEQAQRKLEATSAELRAAAALRDDFLTVASHELRTPLTTLGLQLDGLLLALHQTSPHSTPVPKLLEKANRLRTQADRLEALIEGMLDVFNLGSNNLVLQLAELDLADAARSVVSRLALEYRSIHIELRSEPSPGMWDRVRVEQIITALVSNALKFGAGRAIEVGVGGTSTSGRVWVRDRGIGIAEYDQERIFGRFVRVAPSNQYAGFGLGLWIVQEIVKAMGGQVQVLSQLGSGSTFTVELPRSP